MERWSPRRELSRREEFLMKRLTRTRKLFAFLREHRHEVFDESLQADLESMYRDNGAGLEPIAPALLAMAVLLQGYVGASDAEAVELTVVDLRWQMVLDCIGAEKPVFSQGTLQDFRERLIRTEMDRRLLERAAEIARSKGGFDAKKLPKSLRVAIDSAPLQGAGRVEDTINLLAHAARKVVECAADLVKRPYEQVCRDAGIPLLRASSAKKALDVEWSDPKNKSKALDQLVDQISALQRWVEHRLPSEMKRPPLQKPIEVLKQLMTQDLEPDPTRAGSTRIRRGVAEDRRVSVEDADMRHGRKSKSQRFNGYKRHIASDLDSNAIVACEITPANRAEVTAVPQLKADIARQKLTISELHIDRGYIGSPLVDEVIGIGGDVYCKPWVPRRSDGLFTKMAFEIDVRRKLVTCPAGEKVPIEFGAVAKFGADTCDTCELRARCTHADAGRSIAIGEKRSELLQIRLRKRISTPNGRDLLRERVVVEHGLAHIVRRQGRRARYRGTRRNLYDLRRAATIQNLETAARVAIAA